MSWSISAGRYRCLNSKDALSGGIALNSSTLMIRALCFRRC
jgi:hypothetical protein